MRYLDQFGQTGIPGNDREHLNGPEDVACAVDGSILVADGEPNRRVVRLTEDFRYLDQFGQTGIVHTDRLGLRQALGICAGHDGSLFIIDVGQPKVLSYRLVHISPDMRYLKQFGKTDTGAGGREMLSNPLSPFLGPEGSIYVCDQHRVIRLTPDFKYLNQFGRAISGSTRETCFWAYRGVVESSGMILICETGNERLIRIDESLRYLNQFGETAVWGTDREHIQSPEGLAVGPDHSIYISDMLNHRVVRLDPSFNFVDQFGRTGTFGSDRQHLKQPYGLAVQADGNLLICDYGNHRIVRVTED